MDRSTTVVRPVREEKRREEWEEKESVEEDQGARNDRKHISNSKGTKHTILGALLEVDMFKNCTRLWHKVHFGVNSTEHLSSGALLEVEIRQKSARSGGAKHMSKSKC